MNILWTTLFDKWKINKILLNLILNLPESNLKYIFIFIKHLDFLHIYNLDLFILVFFQSPKKKTKIDFKTVFLLITKMKYPKKT